MAALHERILEVMGGEHVAAIATVADGMPAVRFMTLIGHEDLSLVGATAKASRKVRQIREKPDVALAIWSCREFTDPYVRIQSRGEIHEDRGTKQRYWNPRWDSFFQSPPNPEFVDLRFIPRTIEYYRMGTLEVRDR